jgi:putative transposase
VALGQWPPYTATATVLYAHELGLVPTTMPATARRANGLAKAFVKTFKRDYVNGADFATRKRCWRSWAADLTTTIPGASLGARDAEPADYRADANLSSSR